jgi:hypothetical protein
MTLAQKKTDGKWKLPYDFALFAKSVGINLNDKEDYEAWLECWENGYKSAVEDLNKFGRTRNGIHKNKS